MIDYVTEILSPSNFVPVHKKRKNGTFEIKFELYGV